LCFGGSLSNLAGDGENWDASSELGLPKWPFSKETLVLEGGGRTQRGALEAVTY
jgi:hypothetical protein